MAKNDSTSFYGSIVALAESPLVEGLIYAGTDDGLIQVTEDGGKNWRKIENFPFTNKPSDVYVSDIETSRHDPNTVYACFDNHQNGDFKPYLLRSADRGKSWTNIGGDLPERGTVYTIAVDHEVADLLFVGTEFGVFATRDGGQHWHPLEERHADRSPSATWKSSAGRTTWSWAPSAGAFTSSTTTRRSATRPRSCWPSRPRSCRSRRPCSTCRPRLWPGETRPSRERASTRPRIPPSARRSPTHLKEALKTEEGRPPRARAEARARGQGRFLPRLGRSQGRGPRGAADADSDRPECRRADRAAIDRPGLGGIPPRELGPALAGLPAGDRGRDPTRRR